MIKKLVIRQICLLIFQCIMYFGCEIFQHHLHDVKCKYDDYIPFIPISGLVYCLWFPLIFLFPIILGLYDYDMYRNYLVIMILEIIISVIIYLIYPTTFKRPDCDNNASGILMQIIYKGSFKGVNCAPSLHCSSCYLVIYSSIFALNLPMIIKLVAIIISISIIISTLTTKQHTIIDVVSAICLFLFCLLIKVII